jgi:glutaconate CoA-transferase subunit B
MKEDHTKYTSTEFMICLAARAIEDNKTVFVGFGMPQIAAILAQKIYSPNICQVYEYGAVGTEVVTPFRRNMMADARNSYRAISWMNMNTVMSLSSLGFIDYGILGAAQIDIYGNVNSTVIGGTYERPKLRLVGSGGANEVASLCWKTIYIMEHEKRRFLKKIDFITSPGYLDGTPKARENTGLPSDTGPSNVITSMAMFDFDLKSHMMRLIATVPGVDAKTVLDNMEFEPLVADKLDILKPPTPQELTLLREVIDPDRVVIGRIE